MTRIDYLEARAGVHLAYQHRAGRGPTLLFLPGYASDMTGGKASALDAWAEREGRAMLRFDYGGCGMSGGDFEAQTPAALARRRAGDDRPGRGGAAGAGRLVDGRLADAARRARAAGAGRRPGRDRRRARFHRLGLHRGGEADHPLRRPARTRPTPMARRRPSPRAISGRAARRCASPTRRSRSIARSACCTARRTRTCPGPGRCSSPGWSVQPMCR